MSCLSGVMENLGSRRSTLVSERRAAGFQLSPSTELSTRIFPSPPTCASDSRKVQNQRSSNRIRSVKALCFPLAQIFLAETRLGALAGLDVSARIDAMLTTMAAALRRNN